jgi:hypothetical protein|nr:MAG TPA: Minor capsid protein [Caudoviricetes sp.]DAV50826.1 MAG TPA: Minor capsid protein [Caudoviricetes sp.]
MSVKVEIYSPGQTVKRIFNKDVMKYAQTRLHAYCSPYVPMDSGTLDQKVSITEEYVHYKSPYAHFQWAGKVFVDDRGSTYAKRSTSKHPTSRKLKYSTDKHPLATSHWEQAMAVAKGEQLAADIEDYIKRK